MRQLNTERETDAPRAPQSAPATPARPPLPAGSAQATPATAPKQQRPKKKSQSAAAAPGRLPVPTQGPVPVSPDPVLTALERVNASLVEIRQNQSNLLDRTIALENRPPRSSRSSSVSSRAAPHAPAEHHHERVPSTRNRVHRRRHRRSYREASPSSGSDTSLDRRTNRRRSPRYGEYASSRPERPQRHRRSRRPSSLIEDIERDQTDSDSQDSASTPAEVPIAPQPRSLTPWTAIPRRVLGPAAPRELGLTESRTGFLHFKNSTNYRAYWLSNRTERRLSSKELRTHRRDLRANLGQDDSFDGSDPILILRFLASFTEQCEELGVSGRQALQILPSFLKGEAKSEYQQAAAGDDHSGTVGFKLWDQAVHYLLCKYATANHIQNATVRFRALKQDDNEDELQFHSRILKEVQRCGGVWPYEERMDHYVSALNPTVRPLVQSFRSQHPGVTLDALAEYAKSVGDAARSQRETLSRSHRTSVIPRIHTQVALADSVPEPPPFPEPFPLDRMKVSDQEDGEPSEDSTDSVNYANRGLKPQNRNDLPRIVPAPGIPGGPTTTPRPGWVDREADPNVICLHCYGKGHYRNQCKTRWKDFRQVIVNYESLTEEERTSVAPAAYLQCKEIEKNCLRASHH